MLFSVTVWTMLWLSYPWNTSFTDSLTNQNLLQKKNISLKFTELLILFRCVDFVGSDNETSSEDTSEDSDSTIHVGKPSPRRADHKCPVECDQDIHKTTLELRAKRFLCHFVLTHSATLCNCTLLCMTIMLGFNKPCTLIEN